MSKKTSRKREIPKSGDKFSYVNSKGVTFSREVITYSERRFIDLNSWCYEISDMTVKYLDKKGKIRECSLNGWHNWIKSNGPEQE